MIALSKIAALGLALTGAALLGGCTSGYYDNDGYYHGYRHRDSSYYSGDRDDRYWGDRDESRRVRVCDADGDDCHWEYRRR